MHLMHDDMHYTSSRFNIIHMLQEEEGWFSLRVIIPHRVCFDHYDGTRFRSTNTPIRPLFNQRLTIVAKSFGCLNTNWAKACTLNRYPK